MNSEHQLNPKIVIAITRQLNDIMKKSPDGVKIIYNESDILDINADIAGPVETPYQGGIYRCKLVIPADFPKNPPKGYFNTKIFHPNVSEKGEICVNTLKKDWNSQVWSISHILEVIRCLLIIPFPESALNEEAGKLFMEDYDEYFKHAKLYTEVYAQPKKVENRPNSKEKSKSQMLKEDINNKQQFQDVFIPVKENVNEQPGFFSNAMRNCSPNTIYDKNKEINLITGNNKTFVKPENCLVENQYSQANVMQEEQQQQSFQILAFNNIDNNSMINKKHIPINLTFNSNFQNIQQSSQVNITTKKENDKKKWLKRI